MEYKENCVRYGRWQFDTEKPSASMEIVCPDGSKETVGFFKREEVKLVKDYHGYESAVPTGRVFYSARFTPAEAGEYTFVTDQGECGGFSVTDTGLHGYVEVGKKDPRYFAFTDGTPFPVIGTNLATLEGYRQSSYHEFGTTDEVLYLGVAEYERWFRKLAKAGGNHARIWCNQAYFAPDTDIDPTVLDLTAFEKLDALVEAARKYGIYLKLSFDHFRFFLTPDDTHAAGIRSAFGKKFTLNGKECTSMDMWLTDPDFKAAWIAKVRQYLLRYAGDPIVMCFELWNEMNAVEADYDTMTAWNREMVQTLRPFAPKNLWVQSLGSMDSTDNITIYDRFPFDAFDFSQFHRYLDQGAPLDLCHTDGYDFTKAGIEVAKRDKKPVILAETGAVNDCHSGPFRYYQADDRGVIFADTVLPAFFLGAAGCGQIWHWNNYVEYKNLFGLLKPLADALTGVQLEDEGFVSENLSTGTYHAALLTGQHTVLGFVRNIADRWDHSLMEDREPEALEAFTLPVSEGKLSIYRIWDDEPAKVGCTDGALTVDGLKYGLIFRIDRD